MLLQVVSREAPRWIAVLSSDVYAALEILVAAIIALAGYIVLLHHRNAKREEKNQKILLDEISASRLAEVRTRDALENNTRVIDKIFERITKTGA